MCPPKSVAIELEMTEFDTQKEAIDHAREHGGQPIYLAGRNLVVCERTIEWLLQVRAVFAYLHELHGRIVTVLVNT